MKDPQTLFAERGLRCTKQRVEVFAALAATTSHPTAEELHRAVNERCASDSCRPWGAEGASAVSLATVYNTLEALCRVGLVRKITGVAAPASGAGAGARYEADLSNHLHLTTPDGGVRDVPADLSERLLQSMDRSALAAIEQRLGVKVATVRVELVAHPGDR